MPLYPDTAGQVNVFKYRRYIEDMIQAAATAVKRHGALSRAREKSATGVSSG